MHNIRLIKDIPANRVDHLIELLKTGGATNVTKIAQGDGTFTVSFEQPDAVPADGN